MAISIQVDKYEVFKATAENITLTVYKDGGAATLSNASYILYDNGTTEKSSGSITPSTNTLTVSIASTYFTVVRENCRIKWTFTVSAVAYTFNTLFDVVSSKVCNTVVDADLLKEYPELDDELPGDRSPANYSPQIHAAFTKFKNDVRAKNHKPNQMIDITPEPFKDIIVQKSLALIFRNRFREEGDRWWLLYKEHEAEYQKLFDNAKFNYDTNDDSVVDEFHDFSSVRFGR